LARRHGKSSRLLLGCRTAREAVAAGDAGDAGDAEDTGVEPQPRQLPLGPRGHRAADGTVGAEAGQHPAGGETGEGTQGADPQTTQEVGQLGPVEERDRPGGKEAGSATGYHDHRAPAGVVERAAGCQRGGEQAVGHTDAGCHGVHLLEPGVARVGEHTPWRPCPLES